MVDYAKSEFLQKWREDMTTTLKRMHPEWDDREIDSFLLEMIEEDIQNPRVELDNNYTHENKQSTLLSVFDWVEKREPIIAGNGTFYKNQHEAINPVANMLDGMLTMRKKIKAEMFKIEDAESDIYKDKDRGQQNEKVNANSYYGGSGAETSAFYSKWSAPATTLTAQSIITTTETTFEAFFGDNFKFVDINECFHWMNVVVDEDYELDNFIEIQNVETVFKRLKSQFINYKDDWEDSIRAYLSNLSPDDLTRIYYKNQLMKFTSDHKEISKLYERVFRNLTNLDDVDDVSQIPNEYRDKFNDVKKYNKHVHYNKFMDPNNVPDTVKDDLNQLNHYYLKYVYVPYIQIDKIYKLKSLERKVVMIVDTDSNILTCDAWVEFCQENIMKSDYGRTTEENVFVAVNSITYVLTNVIADTLLKYGEHSNIPEDYRGRFKMKNEFFFTKLIIGKKKKRYCSVIKLREGELFKKPKTDIKGFDFMKSTTSEEAESLYKKMVENKLLYHPTVDVKGLINELRQFESDIEHSIRSGDTTYLAKGSAKELKAYKDPYSEQSVRGVIAWNFIYPDNSIDLPSKISLVKLKIYRPEDMKQLQKTDPDIYDTILTKIFGSPIKGISSKGLQVLAIPSNSQIPEWCRDYIDYTTTINTIISSFNGVLDLVDIVHVPVGRVSKGVGRKSEKFTNIVQF